MTANKRLSNEELAAIRERAEKATEGDGRLYVEKHCEDDYDIVDYNGDIQFAAFDRDTATFIANARQDIPKLLTEIERTMELTQSLGDDFSKLCTILYGRYEVPTDVADEIIEILAKYERKGLILHGGDND